MSYDIHLEDSTGATLMMPEAHRIAGGTMQLGGTLECWLNVTYNYSNIFRPMFALYHHNSDRGIRTLYGMTGEASVPLLEEIISKLTPDEGGYSYWEATEGNARRALEGLLTFAKQHPTGIWAGD